MADLNGTKVDLKALFGEFDLADAAWEKAKLETESAYRLRSDIVQKISEALPADDQRVMRNGQEIVVVKRDVKQDDGTVRPTFFLRGNKKQTKKLIEV